MKVIVAVKQGAGRGDAGSRAQGRSEGDLNMTALVIAEHDNASIKGATSDDARSRPADYGLGADLFAAVPELSKSLA